MEKETSQKIKEDVQRFTKDLSDFITRESSKLDQLQKAHQQTMKKKYETETELQEEGKVLKEIVQDRNRRVNEETSKCVQLEKDLDDLSKMKTVLPGKINELVQKQGEKGEEFKQSKSEIEAIAQEKEYKMSELERGVSLFQKWLGLDFKTSDGILRLNFTHVDPERHDRKFSVAVMVDENNQYQVFECSPQIVTIDTLVERLNDCNDFAWFVQTVRREFKLACTL